METPFTFTNQRRRKSLQSRIKSENGKLKKRTAEQNARQLTFLLLAVSHWLFSWEMRQMRPMGQIRQMGDCAFGALPISSISPIGLISPILNALWVGYRFQYLWLWGGAKKVKSGELISH